MAEPSNTAFFIVGAGRSGTNFLRSRRDWRTAHHARTLTPVSADSIEKWRDQLAPGEVALIEVRCAEGMRAAGHDFATCTGRLLGGMGVRAGETVESVARALERRLGVDRLFDNRQRAES
ncbi:hypothetical protein [Caenispirillum salinarum]|uniref:hypothetical protein n=1 Tax=Caenispirillum salinarum TaxID=859058 RepID=UPI0038515070